MKMEKRIELGKKLQALVFKSTGQNETTDSQGGYAVQHDLLPDILAPNFAEGTLYSRCKIYNANSANGIKIPLAAESTRTTSGIKGGVRAYWVGEGQEATDSTAQFSLLEIGLNKCVGLIYVTDRLLEDAPVLAQYISDAVTEAIMWQIDRAILYGGGASLNGIAGSAVTIPVAATDPITLAELKDMYHSYYGGKDGVWVMSKNGYEEIIDLDLTTAPNVYDPTPSDGAPMGRIMGLPIMVSDVIEEDDIVLGDFGRYVVAQTEMTSGVNLSLKFVESEKCFMFVLRIGGKVGWYSRVTLQDGSVVSPFVMKTDMDESSSSEVLSSSSSSSQSSATSSSSESHDSSSSSSSYSSESTASSSSSSEDYSSSSSSSTQSSASTQSESSESSSSQDSSSSSSHLDCEGSYCAQGFATSGANGTYVDAGDYNDKAYYANGNYLVWYDSTTGYWAMSEDLGDPQNQWISSVDTPVSCPDGDVWVSEDGTLTAGACS